NVEEGRQRRAAVRCSYDFRLCIWRCVWRGRSRYGTRCRTTLAAWTLPALPTRALSTLAAAGATATSLPEAGEVGFAVGRSGSGGVEVRLAVRCFGYAASGVHRPLRPK